MTQDTTRGRTVFANISLSLDGRITGPEGEYDTTWVEQQHHPHLARRRAQAP